MSLAEARSIATAINERVQRLRSEGVTDAALLERMVSFLPDLNRLWNQTSDATLASLCREFSGFYRYAQLMEDGYAAWQAGGGPGRSGEELPAALRDQTTRLLTEAASLERELQALLASSAGPDSSVQPLAGLTARASAWRDGIVALDAAMRAQGIPEASRATLARAFQPLIERIGQLHQIVGTRR